MQVVNGELGMIPAVSEASALVRSTDKAGHGTITVMKAQTGRARNEKNALAGEAPGRGPNLGAGTVRRRA